MRRSPSRLLALLVAASVAAVGCGSPGEDEKGAGAPTLTEIKVAVVAPLSGSYQSYGKPIADGERLAADEINRAGGIASGPYKGARIRIVEFDDQLDPKQDADAAQKVVDDPSIWAFTGLASSDGALAAKPILNRAGVPLVSSYASSPEITRDARRTFIIPSPHAAYSYSAAQAAKDAGSRSVAILQITGAFGDSISKLAQQALTAKGLRVATVQTMSSGDTNVSSQVLAAKDSGADTFMTVGYAADVVAAVTTAQKLSWKPRLLDAGGGAFDPTLLKGDTASAAEGLVGVVDYDADSGTPANRAFTQAYKARTGSADVPPQAAHGYETIKLIAAALETGPRDRAALGDAMAKVTLQDTGVGPLRFDPEGNPLDRPMWVFTVRNGAFVFSHGYRYDGRDVARLELRR